MTETVVSAFRGSVAKQVEFLADGPGRFRVVTPFGFDDGDLLTVVLKREGDTWLLSDEGQVFMRLSYLLDERALRSGTRQEIIVNTLSSFGLQDRDGELVLPVEGVDCGEALFAFSQAALRVSDIRLLTREIIRSTFLQDFNALLSDIVPEDLRTLQWHEPIHDPAANYVVDCRVETSTKPLFIFALQSDERTSVATIALHQFREWGLRYTPLGIFQEQENINPKVLARYSDIGDKLFSHIPGNEDNIRAYIEEHCAA
ncbi:MAG: DUF1828 domain-containing protein [Armatimonadetes bacterium]|nr:DUF1828 domain-containing protein [Armatimonadota bacterium]